MECLHTTDYHLVYPQLQQYSREPWVLQGIPEVALYLDDILVTGATSPPPACRVAPLLPAVERQSSVPRWHKSPAFHRHSLSLLPD